MYSQRFLKRQSRQLQRACFLLGALSAAAALLSFWPLWIAAWAGVFLTAAQTKRRRRNGSLWVFCLSVPVILPLNAHLLKDFFLYWTDIDFIAGSLVTLVVFFFLFSLMELTACMLSRWLWPRQTEYTAGQEQT